MPRARKVEHVVITMLSVTLPRLMYLCYAGCLSTPAEEEITARPAGV